MAPLQISDRWTARLKDFDQAGLPAAIRDRIPVALERAAVKAAAVQASPSALTLLRAARHARNVGQRVIWLHRFASSWVEPFSKVSACRRGCAHCCHLPLAITSAEARHIARHTGRPAASPPGAIPIATLTSEKGCDEAMALAHRTDPGPCPFLAGEECTIYPWRPVSCRLHVSLDDDDLLCRLAPGQPVPVPYVDVRQATLMALAAQAGESLADIRDFFPSAP